MQKLLKKQQQGFTLVELLVAIAIIAILAVIGLTVFTGLQRGARDATRKSDVQAISKALEANYQTSTALYVPLVKTQFAGGSFPQDPVDTSANACAGNYCGYCVAWTTGGAPNPTGQLVGATGTPCTTGAVNNGTHFNRSTADGVVPLGSDNPTGYIVCANMETGGASGPTSFYCQGNQR